MIPKVFALLLLTVVWYKTCHSQMIGEQKVEFCQTQIRQCPFATQPGIIVPRRPVTLSLRFPRLIIIPDCVYEFCEGGSYGWGSCVENGPDGYIAMPGPFAQCCASADAQACLASLQSGASTRTRAGTTPATTAVAAVAVTTATSVSNVSQSMPLNLPGS